MARCRGSVGRQPLEGPKLTPLEIADYLCSLPSLWADAGHGRQVIVRTIFARTDVLAFRRLEYELTPDAIAQPRAPPGQRDPESGLGFLRAGARPAVAEMSVFIDEHRRSFGVEPICRTFAIAPSSYYAAKTRPPSARQVNDATLADVIGRVHRAHFGVYGIRKVWKTLGRLGIEAGRDQVARIMRSVGLQGATRTKRTRTTKPAPVGQRPADLVRRVFSAPAPNRLWVADLTYVWTVRGFVYTAFIVDAFSRRIVGWRVSASLRTDLALDALEMALFARGPGLSGLVHHSDRGVQQYLSVRYTSRLAEAEAVGSVGSKGDSYDNALAETVNGLYKAELIRRHAGPWHSVEEVELATADWVDFWNTRRLHAACGYLPPAEFESAYDARSELSPAA